MSFPHHDENWTSVAAYLKARCAPQARILAPDIFWWQFPRITRYAHTAAEPSADYDWVVIHKGELEQISSGFLRRLLRVLPAVYANPVFVVFSSASADRVPHNSPHLVSLWDGVASLPPGERALVVPDKPVLPDEREITNFATLSDDEVATAMDWFWSNGGYLYTTLRDQVYSAEMDRCIAGAIRDAPGTHLLDVACGTGRMCKMDSQRWEVTGVDISRVAIGMAQQRHRHLSNFRFEVMSAQSLQFPDATFDLVLLVDAIEHVRDAGVALKECARVLRPGGHFLLTAANSSGLNQVMMRKLGYPEFVTNYQHIREFTLDETKALLRAAGLELESARGIFLYPYWGIPGIDSVVRHLTDHDPEVVEMFRILGERAGPEYSYTAALTAIKPAAVGATPG